MFFCPISMLNYETNRFILIILYILSNCKLILAQYNRSALQTECGGAFASLRQRRQRVHRVSLCIPQRSVATQCWLPPMFVRVHDFASKKDTNNKASVLSAFSFRILSFANSKSRSPWGNRWWGTGKNMIHQACRCGVRDTVKASI